MTTIKRLGQGPGNLPFCQGVLVDNLYFMSGVIGVDLEKGCLVEGGIKAETAKCFDHLKESLALAGMDLSNIVKVTVYLRNMEDYAEFNGVYADLIGSNPPAREAAAVSGLALDAHVGFG